MWGGGVRARRAGRAGLLFLGMLITAGCTEGAVTGGIVGATYWGGRAPSGEIEQVYYLGVFDPQGQLPPQIYRVRVHGQSSFISAARFASGWVPAALADSLGSNISFSNETGSLDITRAEEPSALQTGRRLMMFGPEGFREAPADHRLVIAMGGNVDDYFDAVNQSLSVLSQVEAAKRDADFERRLTQTLLAIQTENRDLGRVETDFLTTSKDVEVKQANATAAAEKKRREEAEAAAATNDAQAANDAQATNTGAKPKPGDTANGAADGDTP